MYNKGDKVICTIGSKEQEQPVKGECYTVRKYEIFAGCGLVYLEGFKRGGFFHENRFRPLHDAVSNAIIKEVGSYPKYLK